MAFGEINGINPAIGKVQSPNIFTPVQPIQGFLGNNNNGKSLVDRELDDAKRFFPQNNAPVYREKSLDIFG